MIRFCLVGTVEAGNICTTRMETATIIAANAVRKSTGVKRKMTELERCALLGDRQAQEECTRRGIMLPCWKCGGKAEVNELHTGGKPIYAVACKKHYCGAYGAGSASVPKAIAFWNTRPAPPIGRCEDCANWYKQHCASGPCATEPTDADFFCGNFEPKGGEENG